MSIPTLRCSVAPVRSGAPDAELLVLGPSLGTTSELWSAVLDVLSERYRVLRYDLPGHGFSPAATQSFSVADLADAVVDLVDEVGGGAFHYAGVSLGGAVGLQLGLRHPSRLSSLTAICTGAKIGETEGWTARAAQVRASGTASVVAGSARRWFAPGFLERDPDAGGAALNALLQIDDESYALCCEALGAHDVTARLGEIEVRTLAVAGEADQAAPPAKLRELADGIPGARYAEIAGAAHLPMLERPAELVRLVLGHIHGVAADAVTDASAEASTRASRTQTNDETFAAGVAVRRAVLGDAHVDASTASITPETADFQDFITRYAWGDVWTRPGLDRRTRSFITIAALVSSGHENEVAMHIRAALTNGLTRAEISETLLHVAIYAGVPAANSAFAIAREVFAALDADAEADS
ncbi:MAG: 4-carboxymuconolactone decarboxylase [Microbacteriaceae bacterium]|nr:MAG: 4-carboxymuconolactone decarboxylase [Microbacteriaceae bacterium]